MIAEIVFPIPLHRTFYYRVPPSLAKEGKGLIGLRAGVSFGRRLAKGLITAVHQDNEVKLNKFIRIKEIDFLIDKKPLFGEGFVDLILWIAKKWDCPLGLVFASFYVPVKNLESDEVLKVLDGIAAEFKIDNAAFGKNLYPFQEGAVKKISGYLSEGKKKTVLLYGPPKSGKAEICARAIKASLENSSDSQALWLVPDIHLINPVLNELKAKFPSATIDLWHSKITPKKRLETWKRIVKGEARIIIGARSAAMLPFKRLKLAVIDEEHDDMYKQEETEPHFHARDIILKRAEAFGTCVILGSSCPSIESYNSALDGDTELIELNPDVSHKPLFEIVDSKMYPAKMISDPLLDKIKNRLEKNEQILLVVNRKGFSFSVNCVKCGWKKYCPKCGVPMTVRKDLKTGEKTFFCWRCSKKDSVPDACPKCQKKIFRQRGVGTQRLEDEIREIFPKAKVFRFDGTTGIKFSPDDINDSPDIIIGTRIAARGYNFPRMSLVGVFNPEIDASPSDFRSAEKLFQMLLEASGRLSQDLSGGEFIIQTNDPDYYVLPAFINSDYKKFALEEIKMRKKFSYPPFSNMARVIISGKDSKKIKKFLGVMIAALETEKEYERGDIEILGPLGSFAAKARASVITECLIIRGKKEDDVLAMVKKIRGKKPPKGFFVKVFVNPYNFR